jgi:hypothetical protein
MKTTVHAMAARAFRRGAAPLAAAMALLGTVGVNTASADVHYDSYTWIGIGVNITSPHNVSGGAGQITLNLDNHSTILAWCLDIFDWLQPSGTYAVGQTGLGNMTPQSNGHIGGLMVEGNQLIAQLLASHTNFTAVNGYAFSVQDVSAAAQVAIWGTEYQNFVYSTSVTGFANLVQYLNDHAGNSGFYTLDPDPANCTYSGQPNCTSPTNQHLGYVPVPSPVTGAGLPGLVAACAALIAFARRRRRAIACEA